jgi:hypothetical protein
VSIDNHDWETLIGMVVQLDPTELTELIDIAKGELTARQKIHQLWSEWQAKGKVT